MPNPPTPLQDQVETLAPQPVQEEKKEAYNPSVGEQDILRRLKKRIGELKSARQLIVSPEEGKSIEGIWRDCEKMYVPHRFYSTALQEWQSKASQPVPYSKIMTALAVIVANNPEVVLRASAPEYEKKTNLMKALYSRSWKVGLGKEQLKNFVFNLATKGFAVGRTYPRKITRKIRDITSTDIATGQQQYEEKEVEVFNEVFFENMNPWNCWIDDMALPSDPWSIRDWAWRQVWSLESLKRQYHFLPNAVHVQAGGNIEDDSSGFSSNVQKTFTTKDLVECFYYENQETDEFHIEANGVLLTPEISPLPYKHKRLSCTFTQWTPRSATSLYGIGIIEAIKEDQDIIDKIRNMSIDELVLSIYQMFFHGPATNFAEGKLRVEPGRLIQVTNPNDVKPVQFNPPSQQTVQWLEMIGQSQDEASGVTKSLSGEFIGKTAFEVQQNREAGLRKMKVPVSNIEYALTLEARNHIDLLQQAMVVPQDVRRIAGVKTFQDYEMDALQNPDLYFIQPEQVLPDGGAIPKQIFRNRSVMLNLEDNEKGYMESKTTNSFNITPEMIRWEGEIEIQPQSMLVRSIELERQMTLDLFNVVAQLPTTALAKAQNKLLKTWGEDPDNWMPTEEELAAKRQMEAMMMQEQAMGGEAPMEEVGSPETIVPRDETAPAQNDPQMVSGPTL